MKRHQGLQQTTGQGTFGIAQCSGAIDHPFREDDRAGGCGELVSFRNIKTGVFSKTFGSTLWEANYSVKFAGIKKNSKECHLISCWFCAYQVIILLLPSFGWRMFEKAGTSGWKGLYSFLQHLCNAATGGKAKALGFWQLIPVAGWVYIAGHLCGVREDLWEVQVVGACHGGLAAADLFPDDRYDAKVKFAGAGPVRKYRKGTSREWSMPGFLPL